MDANLKYFLPYQREWITCNAPLKLMQKSRQVGISYADAYHYRVFAAANGGGIYTSQIIPAPVLKMTQSGDSLLLSWIVPSMEFGLQEWQRSQFRSI
jgi:hypothetical protein